MVRARTSLINTARGLTKSYGERLRGCSLRKMNRELAGGLSPELQGALETDRGLDRRREKEAGVRPI
jgi:transposase